MGMIRLLVLPFSLSCVAADQTLSDGFNTNSENYDQLQELDMSPFAAAVYKYASSSGVFNKLFEVPMTPAEAKFGFYNSALHFVERYGVPQPESFHTDIAAAAEKAFRKKLTPLNYFKVFTNTIEDYLLMTGIITPDNAESLAYSYHKAIDDLLKASGDSINNSLAVYILNKGNYNFLDTFGDMPTDVAQHVLEKFLEEICLSGDSSIKP